MQKELEGWKILMCYAVPPGCVINKDNFNQYSLIECGTYISEDKNWVLQVSWQCTNGNFYQLLPNTQEAMHAFFSWYSDIRGSIEYINQIKEKLDVYILRSRR